MVNQTMCSQNNNSAIRSWLFGREPHYRRHNRPIRDITKYVVELTTVTTTPGTR